MGAPTWGMAEARTGAQGVHRATGGKAVGPPGGEAASQEVHKEPIWSICGVKYAI